METEFVVDPRDAFRFFESKRIQREKILATRYEAEKADAERIIDMIRENYNPLRIWQWGSLIHRERFSEISDIDIALEGLGDVDAFFSMYGKAQEMTDFPLDIVELENVEPLHAESIRRAGNLVYERP